jgi:hypothetical protein
VSLILKRASTSRPSGEWSDDDYDVLADGAVVGRITKVTRYRRALSGCRMVRSHAAAGAATTRNELPPC